ncbi:hypothetical protein [uncultured Psychroserpens sp.]|uniref:hypothetical protein n=1 Tax=uncultured Psychroserpens sp. TaxID=255436 RepID=UPI002608E546|nr:hypothetical protein [uncultured Psychroserpens sp.]
MENITYQSKLDEILYYYRIQDSEDLDKAENKIQIKLYFDTYDIITMILGLCALSKPNSIDINEFDQNESLLIYASVVRGWLDNIHLLKSHQDEFLIKLNDSDLMFTKDQIVEDLKLDFIGRIDIDNIKNNLKTADSTKNYFEQIQVNCESLFKINYLLNPTKWIDRSKLYSNNVIFFKKYKLTYEELGKTEIFKDALSILNTIRPKVKQIRSNYIDAIAISQLQQELDLFNSKKTKTLPLFYKSTSTLGKALDELTKLEKDYLTYKRGSEKISIFRGSDYYKIDSIFNALKKQESSEIIEDLEAIKNEIKNTFNKEVSGNSLIDDPERTLELIKNDININFYEKIWFDNDGYKEILKTLSSLTENNNKFNKKDVQTIISRYKKEVSKEYKNEIEYLKNLNDVWDQFKHIDFNKLKDLLPEKRDINLYTDFALTRFPLSSKAYDIVTESMENLFGSLEKNDNLEFQTNIINGLANCLYAEKISDRHVSYFVILWILGEYDLICSLFSFIIKKRKLLKTKPNKWKFEEIGVLSIYGASLIMCSPPQRDELIDLINLFKLIDQPKDDLYRIHMLIAYFSFQVWDNASKIIIPEMTNKKLDDIPYRAFYDNALDYGELTKDKLSTLKDKGEDKLFKERKYYYMINSILYYTTRGGNLSDFEKLDVLYFELISIQNENYLWQGRFWDTFAWYHFREAYILKQKDENYSKELKQAYEFNQKCFSYPNTKRELGIYNKLRTLIHKIDTYNIVPRVS